ncbi:hypothetical protein ACG2F4_05035 [Halalkalibaculum sp. DA3122]|uniref:hypothetical protein n=1 Tax=Halalkalibaculum sp. DA3122 TaxID=3373607 RepID=UPI003754E19E
MKIQTTAQLKALSLNGRSLELPASQTIELEFSAIDTGGGFRDAILDFTIRIPNQNGVDFQKPANQCDIVATMQTPDERKREATFSSPAEPVLNDESRLEVNGRLKDEMLSRELAGFMMHLLR